MLEERAMSDPEDVLDYWLGEVGPEGWYAGGRRAGRARSATRFADLWQAAAGGGLDHWVDGSGPSLAYHRADRPVPPQHVPRLRRGLCHRCAGAGGSHRRRSPRAGTSARPRPTGSSSTCPSMHSEDAGDQARGRGPDRRADAADEGATNLLHARAHREVIRRFGRFPHRNAALGRDSTTAEEVAFLARTGGYGARLRAKRAERQR